MAALLCACGERAPPTHATVPEAQPATQRPLCVSIPEAVAIESDEALPKHLRWWPGLSVRKGNDIVDAAPADVAVARGYPAWPSKGTATGGKRITIMTRCSRYRVGEPVRVLHVLEAQATGHKVGIMGPKAIDAEFVDGLVATNSAEGPSVYDGAVLDSPAVDYNYDITEYVFDTAGTHTIVWRLGESEFEGTRGLVSNMLQIEVVAN